MASLKGPAVLQINPNCLLRARPITRMKWASKEREKRSDAPKLTIVSDCTERTNEHINRSIVSSFVTATNESNDSFALCNRTFHGLMDDVVVVQSLAPSTFGLGRLN